MAETDLYAPVKAFLEAQGYAVKGEVNGCDVVGVRGDEPPVIVELKVAFNLVLLVQGVDRLAMSDRVYIAFPEPPGGARANAARRHSAVVLCRRLGLGVLVIRTVRNRARVEALLDPVPYQPRKVKQRTGKLLREFHGRVGDANTGGATRVKLLTAYRQDAIRCADALASLGPSAPRVLRDATQVDRAAAILQRNVYGWFARTARGVYDLTPDGRAALVTWSDAAAMLASADDSRIAA